MSIQDDLAEALTTAKQFDERAVVDFEDFRSRIIANIKNVKGLLRWGLPEFSGVLVVGSSSGLHGVLVPSHFTVHAHRDRAMQLFPAAVRAFGAAALAYAAVVFQQPLQNQEAMEIRRKFTVGKEIEDGNLANAAAMLILTNGATSRAYLVPFDSDDAPAERAVVGAYAEALVGAMLARGGNHEPQS